MASNPGFTQPCPQCHTPLLFRDATFIGKLVECPKCKHRFTVEDPARKAAAAEQARLAAQAAAQEQARAAAAAEQARLAAQAAAQEQARVAAQAAAQQQARLATQAAAQEKSRQEKEALIRKDREAVLQQEKARKEALIQKDRDAVRGKQPPGDGARGDALPARTRPAAAVTAAPPKRAGGVRLEPLLVGGATAEGKKNVSGGHRKQAKSPEGGVNLGIIITPMLDMAFQLLAFFVATYHPSALERHIDGTLLPPMNPSIQSPQAKDPNTTPVDKAPDDKEAVTVFIKAVRPGQEGNRHDGEPSEILLKRPEDAAPERVADSTQDLETGLKQLAAKLKDFQSKGAKANVSIAADSSLKYLYYIRVFDVCKAAKFENVNFVAPSDLAQTKK